MPEKVFTINDFRKALQTHLEELAFFESDKQRKESVRLLKDCSDEALLEKNLEDDLGLDSLDVVEIVVKLEESFDCWIDMPGSYNGNKGTVKEFIEMLNKHKVK